MTAANPTVKDLSVADLNDLPERPCDFTVCGGWYSVISEIRADALDHNCPSYVVYHDGKSWNVWRNL